jgi:hypothetical protein
MLGQLSGVYCSVHMHQSFECISTQHNKIHVHNLDLQKGGLQCTWILHELHEILIWWPLVTAFSRHYRIQLAVEEWRPRIKGMQEHKKGDPLLSCFRSGECGMDA